MRTEHTILGIMSGSSLDGLDFAVCQFVTEGEARELSILDWAIVAAETVPYPRPWKARLRTAPTLPGRELWRVHADLGHWIGREAANFLGRHPAPHPTLAGSHGHTVFHDPELKFTTQIGDGAAIAERLGLPTVTELRSSDVAAGGQGAPIAPLADQYLFPGYAAYLNLGGIANISVRTTAGELIAGDVSGCCQILDRLAELEDLPYDDGGRLAAAGRIQPELAERIGDLDYHRLPYPKSLANGWVRDELWPILARAQCSVADRLNTFTKWLAAKISADVASELSNQPDIPDRRVLVTGGGANNEYLLEQLNRASPADRPLRFVTPGRQVGDFKEAALVALCALFRQLGRPNALPSATGAARPTVNGALYLPPPPADAP